MKTLRIGVPPGIGDSLWAMTKVPAILEAEGADSAHVVVADCPPLRSKEFLEAFDFVSQVSYESLPLNHPGHPHNVLPDGTWAYTLTRKNLGDLDWWLVPNWDLEHGSRLETWLPQFSIDWDIHKRFRFTAQAKHTARAMAKKMGPYAVFYLGPDRGNTTDGHNRGPMWSVADWVELTTALCEMGLQSLVVVGAEYDRPYADKVLPQIRGLPMDIVDAVGRWEIDETFKVCQGAKFVVSYQSGIGIFSVYLRVPTVLWWRPRNNSILPQAHLHFDEQMATAWAPPDMLEGGTYQGLIYGRCTPQSVAEGLERWI